MGWAILLFGAVYQLNPYNKGIQLTYVLNIHLMELSCLIVGETSSLGVERDGF